MFVLSRLPRPVSVLCYMEDGAEIVRVTYPHGTVVEAANVWGPADKVGVVKMQSKRLINLTTKRPMGWTTAEVMTAWGEGAPSEAAAAYLSRGTWVMEKLEEMRKEMAKVNDKDAYQRGWSDALDCVLDRIDRDVI